MTPDQWAHATHPICREKLMRHRLMNCFSKPIRLNAVRSGFTLSFEMLNTLPMDRYLILPLACQMPKPALKSQVLLLDGSYSFPSSPRMQGLHGELTSKKNTGKMHQVGHNQIRVQRLNAARKALQSKGEAVCRGGGRGRPGSAG